jgi:hypothetical protein
MALDLALAVDVLEQLGPDAGSRIADVRADADALRRETLALAWELGDEDRVIRLARVMLAGFGGVYPRLWPPAATEAPGHEADATPGDVFAAAMRQWREAVRDDNRRAAEEAGKVGRAWRISGSYLEACNCEPMCSRRGVGALAQRRPTRGACAGALSWAIDRGYAGGVNLDGLAMVLAFRDELGSPWSVVLYLDDRADDYQRSALQAVFTGRWGSRTPVAFPWACEAKSYPVAVRTVPVAVDHRARRPWFDAGDYVSLRVGDPVRGQQPSSSLISGHHRFGIERRADRLCVADGPLAFDLSDRRAFQSTFDYASRHAA